MTRAALTVVVACTACRAPATSGAVPAPSALAHAAPPSTAPEPAQLPAAASTLAAAATPSAAVPAAVTPSPTDGAEPASPTEALPGRPPIVGLDACLAALGSGRNPDAKLAQLLNEVRSFAEGGRRLQCWTRTTSAGPVAVIQRRGLKSDALLIGADGHVLRTSAPHEGSVAVVSWVCSLWTAQVLAGSDEPAAPFQLAGMPAGRWWADLPFAQLADGTLTVHAAFDTDFCKGFDVYVLSGPHWQPYPGGGQGCLVPKSELIGIGDLDGDGQPDRLQTAVLADFAGDGEMAAVNALVPIGRAQHLAYDATAGVGADQLRVVAAAELGRFGRGNCWNCRRAADDAADATTVGQCRVSRRAVRCLVQSKLVGRPALDACWHDVP